MGVSLRRFHGTSAASLIRAVGSCASGAFNSSLGRTAGLGHYETKVVA
jgi:hypothetical protein